MDPCSTPATGRAAVVRGALLALAFAAGALAGCRPAPPAPTPPASPPPPPASVAAPSSASPKAPATTPAPLAMPSPAAAEGTIWFCEVAGTRAPIEFDAKVDALCRRHPEMGPCQFERDVCRRRGGRVYTAKGEEVTAAVEAEYDRRVVRIRLQADGAPPRK